jgi:hypothetical protein
MGIMMAGSVAAGHHYAHVFWLYGPFVTKPACTTTS